MPYPHQTFSTIITNPNGTTASVDIPDPQFTDAEKAVVQLAIDGAALFQNPVEGDIFRNSAGLSRVASLLTTLGAAVAGSSPPVPNYDPLYQQTTTAASACINLSTKLTTEFKEHTARISGASGGSHYDVFDGDLFGFNALQGIASAMNSAKDAMRGATAPVEDNYSIHFSSILFSGQSLMEDIESFVGRDGFSVNGLNLGFTLDGSSTVLDTDAVEVELSDLDQIVTIANRFSTDASDLITRDNKALSDSLDFLEKYSRGASVLSMAKDTAFGAVLLEDLQTDTLKTKLGDVDII